MANYGVIDLTTKSPITAGADLAGLGSINLDHLRDQLEEIRDAILPVTRPKAGSDGFGLQTLEIDLTVGAEGKVWFVAKGSLEASIKLTFGHAA